MIRDTTIYDIGLIIVVGTTIVTILSFFVFQFILMYRKRQQEYQNELDHLKFEFEQTLLQSQLEIQEQTLQHVAHELHDNLGQVASLIKIHLNTIILGENEKAKEKVEDAKTLIRQLITDLKHLSANLNGDRIIQLGLLEGLRKEVDRINKLEYVKAILIHEGDIPVLDDQTVIIIYRMSQEIINNVLKHSQAKQLTISVMIQENLLTLEFVDDGLGFDVDDAMKKGGSGLINLHSRAKMIKSKLSLSSSSKGTSIRVDLPVEHARKKTHQTRIG